MVQSVIQLLAVLTLLSNIGLVVALVLYLSRGVDKKGNKYWKRLVSFIHKKEIKFALVGSLYLSEVAHFDPCKLCWYQRIFMYPQVFILATALKEKFQNVFKYALPLSITGFIIAAYHYYFQISGNPLIPCSAVGFSVSCSQRFFTYYGYITIPWMSLSAFSLITFFMLLAKSNKT